MVIGEAFEYEIGAKFQPLLVNNFGFEFFVDFFTSKILTRSSY